MRFLRKSLLLLITPFFVLTLYALAITIGFARIGTHPATIKHILADSGVYKSVTPGLLEQAKQISGGGGDVSLSNPIIKSAAESTFSPQFVQKNTEAALDGVYDWLDGKTPVPDFQIDLTTAKTTFANNVAQAVQQQLAALPPCTAAQTEALSTNFDALSAACLPEGVTAASAASTLQSNILGGKGFLDNPVITADSIKDKNNQPVFTSKNVKRIPMQYQRAKKTPILMFVVAVLLALAIVFLSSTRAAGLRHVGFTLASVGIFLLLFAWGLNHVTTKVVVPKISLNNGVLESSVKSLIVDVEQAIDKSYWWFGGAYAALGVAAISGSMYLKRGGQKLQPSAATDENAAPPEPDVEPVVPANKPKASAGPKRPRKIKVQ